jgi:hypothetical protein
MALPKQIQAQIDAADALLQAPVAAPSPDPAQAPAPVVEAPAPAPVVEPVQAPAPATPASQSELEKAEQRYRTLQGIHNANMERARIERERLAAEVEELRRARDAQPPAAPESAVDPKDADVFGEDLLQAVERMVRAMLTPVVRKFDERLQAVEGKLTNASAMVAQTAEDVFWDALFKRVPDFQTVNSSQEFLDWLQQNDPVSGVQRQQLLDAAGKALNAERVVGIVNAFKATLPAAPAPAPVAQPETPAEKLAKQVSPRTSGGAAPLPAGPQMFSVKTVEGFYRDVAAGKYRGRETEQAQLEKIYNEALAQGRITQ